VKSAGLILLMLAVPVGAQVAPSPLKVDVPKRVAEKVVIAGKYFAEAVALAETIPEFQDKAKAISAIAAMEWRGGEHEQGARDFELVRQIISREAEDDDENITYLLNVMDLDRARAGDIEGALKHVSSMDSSIRDNLYAAVAQQHAEAGDLTAAFNSLSLIEDDDGPSGKSGELIWMFYTAINAGKISDAMEIADRISDSQYKVVALCSKAGQQAKLGRADEASRNLQEALNLAALQSNDQGNSSAAGIRDNSRTQIAQEQATIGRASEAFETVDLIERADAKNAALNSVAEVFAEAGDVEAVRKAVGRVKDPAQKSWLALQVPLAMAKAGDFDGALRIARGTEDIRDHQLLLFRIAQIYLEKGNRGASLALLNEVTDFANAISDEAARGSYFIEIGKMQLAAGDRAAAAASLAKTDKVHENFRITPGILEAQVHAGDVAGALRTAGPQSSEYYNQYYGEIAFTQARSGNYQDALTWVEALKFPYEKAMTLAQLASGILEAK
jgi:hypothetical protein